MRKLLLILSVLFVVSCSKDPIIYTLTTSANPSEGGTVSPTTKQYEEGETATITATPAAEYLFQSWSGATGSSSSTSLVMSSDKSVTANFVKKKYTLTTTVEGEGTVSEKVIKAGAATDYNSGTVVELTATPSAEWLFVEWTGDLTGTDNPKQITIDKAKTVKAVFVKKQYPLTIEVEGEGTVAEKVIKAGAATDYNSGTIVELTAYGRVGWNFVEWQGDLTGNENPTQITIDKAKTVKAIFVESKKVRIRLTPFYDYGIRWDEQNSQMGITNPVYDTIASLSYSVYDEWGQGPETKDRWIVPSKGGYVGTFIDYNTYVNSELKASVKFPKNRYIEFRGWGDEVNSNELSIEFDTDKNIHLKPEFHIIKTSVPNDEFRELLSQTTRDGGLGGNYPANGTKILSYYDRYSDSIPLVNLYNIKTFRLTYLNNYDFKKEYTGVLEHLKDLENLILGDEFMQDGCGRFQQDYYDDFDGEIYPKLKSFSINGLSSIDIESNINLENLSLCNYQADNINLDNNINLNSIKISNSLNLSEIKLDKLTELKNIKFQYLPSISELDFQKNSKIEEYNIYDLEKLSSITFAENDVLSITISGTNLNNLDLSTVKKLQYLFVRDKSLKILDLSNNKDLKTVTASDLENLRCVIASQYQLDNIGNYDWKFPDGVEIKLNCN
jgi:hypothetical protein